MRWYDAQGCLESIGFDFVKRLPLFVVMVMIFQRFSPRGLQLSQRDGSQDTVDNLLFDIEEVNQLLQHFGRRTFGSPASLSPNDAVCNGDENATKLTTRRCSDLLTPIPEESTSLSRYLENLYEMNEVTEGEASPVYFSALDAEVIDECVYVSMDTVSEAKLSPDAKPWFFKSSWKEDFRDSEYNIIRVARERAVKYLKEYSGMVTNHIPKVKAGETCTSFSTSRVRVFMKNVGGNMDLGGDHIEQHSRTRVWMVTRKLQPITGLRADDFWKVFWDIVRCTCSSSIPLKPHSIFYQVSIFFGKLALRTVMSVSAI